MVILEASEHRWRQHPRPRLAGEPVAAKRRLVQEIDDRGRGLFRASGPAPDVQEFGAGLVVGPIAASIGGSEPGDRGPVDRLGEPAHERIDVIDAQIEERREEIETPRMWRGAQLRQGRTEVQRASHGDRSASSPNVVQHLADVLRQRLQVPARRAVEWSTPAVGFAGDGHGRRHAGPPVSIARSAENLVEDPCSSCSQGCTRVS